MFRFSHTLALVNNPARNLGDQRPFQDSGFIYLFIFGKHRSGIAGWYGSSIFNLWRHLLTFFRIGCNNLHCQFPPTVHKCSNFHTSSPALILSLSLSLTIATWTGRTQSGFDMYFHDNQQCWTSFHVPVGYLYLFFGKMSIKVLCPFKNIIVCFFYYWLLLIYFGY